jgi:hypothetical protein
VERRTLLIPTSFKADTYYVATVFGVPARVRKCRDVEDLNERLFVALVLGSGWRRVVIGGRRRPGPVNVTPVSEEWVSISLVAALCIVLSRADQYYRGRGREI